MSALLPVADGRTTWAAARRLLRPHRVRLVLVALVLLASATAGLAVPALLGLLVQTATSGDGTVGGLGLIVAGTVVAALVSAALGAAGRAQMARVTESALASLREDVVDRVLHLPAGEVEAAGEGDVVARVSGDVETVGEAATGVLPAVTAAVFSVVVALAGLGALDWRFAVGALLALPLQLWSLHRFRRRTPPVYAEARRAEGERAQAVLQAVHGAPTVLALRDADAHLDAVARASRTAIAAEMRGVTLVGRFANGANLAEMLGLAGVLTAGYVLVATGTAGVGAATAAALVFHRLFGPMGTLLFQADDLALAGAGLARLVGGVGTPPDPVGSPAAAPGEGGASGRVPNGTDGRGPDGADGRGPDGAAARGDDVRRASDGATGRGRTAVAVDLRDAAFAYHPGRPVLDGVTLRVEPGERVALVGTSGAGKSTLARLVAGTLTPTSGAVDVAGGPAHRLHRERPGHVVLVDQDVHTFTGPLAEDLRLADPDADDAMLAAALDAVGATWWADLPGGLAEPIGPEGTTLRADQAQQLALARVLLADPPVVLLDEATADLPRSRQAALDTAMDALLAGRTALVVAHRLDQAVRCDRVVVLEAGRVVEAGPPDALLAAGGAFHALWTAWSGARAAVR